MDSQPACHPPPQAPTRDRGPPDTGPVSTGEPAPSPVPSGPPDTPAKSGTAKSGMEAGWLKRPSPGFLRSGQDSVPVSVNNPDGLSWGRDARGSNGDSLRKARVVCHPNF